MNEPKEIKIIKMPQLSQQVAEILSSEIRNGVWEPGDWLPSERALVKKYAVSRTVIREALAQLRYNGLILSRQGIGVMVAPSEERLAYRPDELGLGDEKDKSYLYEVRSIIEMEAAALAALRREKDDINKLNQYLDAMKKAIEEGTDFNIPHRAFHQAVAEASKNHYLIDFRDFIHIRLKNMIKEVESSKKSPGDDQIIHEEHIKIVQSIIARDPSQSRKSMLIHLQNAAKRTGFIIFALKRW